MLAPTPYLSKPQIFLVDDDEDDRFLFLDAVTELRNDLDFREFADGETLMATLSDTSSPPDAIFLDLNLPRRNGIECLDYLRTALGDKFTKVFIISTSSSDLMIETTRDKGADLYIRKSENFAHLKDLIKIALQQIHSSVTVPYYLNKLVEK